MTTEVTEGTAESLSKSEEQSPVTFDELGGTVNCFRAHHTPQQVESHLYSGVNWGNTGSVELLKFLAIDMKPLQLQTNAINDS